MHFIIIKSYLSLINAILYKDIDNVYQIWYNLITFINYTKKKVGGFGDEKS